MKKLTQIIIASLAVSSAPLMAQEKSEDNSTFGVIGNSIKQGVSFVESSLHAAGEVIHDSVSDVFSSNEGKPSESVEKVSATTTSKPKSTKSMSEEEIEIWMDDQIRAVKDFKAKNAKELEEAKAKAAKELAENKAKNDRETQAYLEELDQWKKDQTTAVRVFKEASQKETEDFKNNEISKIETSAEEKQAAQLLAVITRLLRENKTHEAMVYFANSIDELRLTVQDEDNYRILFQSLEKFDKNDPLVGEISSVTDVDIQEYIIRQGLDRLNTREAVADLVYAVNSTAISGDRLQRLLVSINVKAGNLTVALLEATKIKDKTHEDKIELENIINSLIAVEKAFAGLMEEK